MHQRTETRVCKLSGPEFMINSDSVASDKIMLFEENFSHYSCLFMLKVNLFIHVPLLIVNCFMIS